MARHTSPMKSPLRLATLALALGAAACSGSISGDAPAGPGGKPGPNKPTPTNPNPNNPNPTNPNETMPPLPPPGSSPLEPNRSSAACMNINPGPAPVRRLTRTEYDNTISDLLGEEKRLAKDFPPEELKHRFDNDAQTRQVSDRLAQSYVAAAEDIGKTVAGKLGSILPCDAQKDGDAACLDRFLDTFALRAWRRPLTDGERADLKKVFEAGKLATFADGIDAVVQVMVLSPQFTYRFERGVEEPGKDYGRLGHYEMASRLSYLLWGTMPDADLFDAAKNGKLGTRDEVAKQATRLLDSPRATGMIQNFAGQWLQLRELAEADKDPEVYPTFKDEHLDLFRRETEGFIAEVWKTDAKLDTFLTAPFSVINGELAALYGATATGADFKKTDLNPAQRAGVLTHASLLAAKAGPDQSSPIHRGLFVLEQLFCEELPAPPAGENITPPALNKTMTTKERFAAHRADPSCATCHDLIDGIGFGFENYDALGQWRTMENGKMVDANGALLRSDVDGKFNGVVELSKKLAASKKVETCVAQHWFNFSFGRPKTAADQCTVETLEGAFAKSGGNMRELLLALVQSDAFFFKGGLQ